MNGKIIRQGDVILIPIESMGGTEITSLPRKNGRLILAEGEVTGHCHAIEAENAELVTADQAAELYLLVHGTDPVDLVHEEHGTVTIPPGVYERRILREYAPEAPRNVVD